MSGEKLYDDAISGDTTIILKLLEEDPYLLDRVSCMRLNRTPLHVGVMMGHVPFVREVLARNPRMAEELDENGSSPLHMASRKGHVEVVRALVSAAPDMCWSRDFQGRNPVHVAVVNGCVEVLAEFVEKCPGAVLEKADHGLSVLGLCVKYGRLEALKELMPRVSELVNWDDEDGNNILHMAVMRKQIEIIKYLIENTEVDVHAKNSRGQTPLAILEEAPQDDKREIKTILIPKLYTFSKSRNQPVTWLTMKRDAIMVVAILTATMAFQAGVTPPGGVWQEDGVWHDNKTNQNFPYKAGEAVIATNQLGWFKPFVHANTVAFVLSLSIILLLISGLPFRRRIFIWLLMVVMWATIITIGIAYMLAVVVVTPMKENDLLNNATSMGILVWSGVMCILLFGNTVRLINRWLKSKGIIIWQPQRFKSLFGVNNVRKPPIFSRGLEQKGNPHRVQI